MWKEIFESKIIRVEGMDSLELVSKVIAGIQEIDRLDPYNQDKAFQLPLSTCVQIVIKSKNSSEKCSVSFNTSLVLEDGVHWLPLFKDTSDFLTGFPEEVKSPRVLMLLHKKLSLDIIKECEKSEISSAGEEDYMPEIKLCSSLIELPYESQFESQDLGEIQNFSVSLSEELQKELKDSLEKTENLLEAEKKANENLKKILETVKNAFLAEINDGKKRENELLEEFKNAESRFAEAKFDVKRLEHEVQLLRSENLRISANFAQLEETSSRQIEGLEEKLRIYESSHSNSDSILTKLSELSQSDSGSVREKEETIKRLLNEISGLKAETLKAKPDDLDEAVLRFSKSHRLQTPFLKEREQIFSFNNKKVSICLKDGNLFYRVGAVLKPLHDFFTNERPKNPENESKPRLSPAQKSLKSGQSRSPKRGYT